MDGIKKVGLSAVKNEALPVAREAIRQLSKTAYNEILDFWLNRMDYIRPELWLDLYSAMQTSDSPDLNNAAMLFSGSDLKAVHSLTLQGVILRMENRYFVIGVPVSNVIRFQEKEEYKGLS